MLGRLLLIVALLAPSVAFAQAPAPTPQDQQQAEAATLADLGAQIVSLRAQYLADQRRIADLEKQIPKPPDKPK